MEFHLNLFYCQYVKNQKQINRSCSNGTFLVPQNPNSSEKRFEEALAPNQQNLMQRQLILVMASVPNFG